MHYARSGGAGPTEPYRLPGGVHGKHVRPDSCDDVPEGGNPAILMYHAASFLSWNCAGESNLRVKCGWLWFQQTAGIRSEAPNLWRVLCRRQTLCTRSRRHTARRGHAGAASMTPWTAWRSSALCGRKRTRRGIWVSDVASRSC